MTVQTWTVTDVCEGVSTALARTFPDEFWVHGEIQSLRRSSPGHLYVHLVEPGEAGHKQDVRLSVVAFKGQLRGIEAVLRKVGNLELTEGIEVRIRGHVEFYPPQGRVQFIMNAIDPRYTLGQLSADRDRVMRALATDGLIEKNGSLPLPLVPLRIGLVTSDGSAAYRDFVDELEKSTFAFRVTLADSRVQGHRATDALVAAIQTLDSLPIDVIAIVRGGGAKGDLLAFDHESVARTVAMARVPVLVGVGHEIDRSVVDEVAHTSLKTPTACAAALVERMRTFTHRLEQISAAAHHHGSRAVAEAMARLDTDAARLMRSTGTVLDAGELTLEHHATAISRMSRGVLEFADMQLDSDAGRAVAACGLRLGQASADLRSRTNRVRSVAGYALLGAERRLNEADSVVRAIHPDVTLARGYSITRGADGVAMRSAAAGTPGETITTELIDGQLTSTITETVPHSENSQKDT